MVYENTVSGERQTWFPTEAAAGFAEKAEDSKKKQELAAKNQKALDALKLVSASQQGSAASHSLSSFFFLFPPPQP